MNHFYILQTSFIILLLITLISGRALSYDDLDKDDDTQSFSPEDEERKDLKSKLSRTLIDNDDDSSNFDSYEERKFHQRSIFNSSRGLHTVTAQTRQALIDILQKAIDQGWRPNLKHYIPATRFGRHRRRSVIL